MHGTDPTLANLLVCLGIFVVAVTAWFWVFKFAKCDEGEG